MSKILLSLFILVVLVFSQATPASATHSWGGYHWARTANPFSLQLGDNLTSSWKPFLTSTSLDWSISPVLDTTIVAGFGGPNCKATAGRVEVCNKKYGNNGWLGIAQIYLSGTHITKGITKLNDTYFNTAKYNVPAWKNLVMCQEVGHNFGLDHQDENFNNTPLGTCMDYSNDPIPNQHPNAHDYEELDIIYAHFDSITTINQVMTQVGNKQDSEVGNEVSNWGQLVRQSKHSAIYERDFGHGQKILTHVLYAD